MVTRQELEAAKVDVKHAGEAVNSKKVITPRYGQPFKSIPLLSEELQQILNNKDLEASQKLQALQNVIEIALAAGAGAAGWTASLVVDAGGKNQQEINDFGGAEWWNKPGGYKLGATVKLENGDIAKSTVANNINDPNVDMTGWVRTNTPDQIFINSDKTQADKNSLSVDLLDFIPKSEWANIIKNISAYNCTPALLSANATGKEIKISIKGTYVFKTPFVTTDDFNLKSDVDGAVFDLQMPTSTNYGFSVEGSVTQISDLSTNVTRGSRQFTLASATGVSVGDWICLYNPTDFSYSAWRDYYRAGEWKQVVAVSGNTVYTDKPFYDSYLIADIDVYKLNSKKVSITGNKIKFQDKTGDVAHLIKVSLCDKPIVDIEFELKKESAIFFDRCVRPKSSALNGFNFGHTDGTTDYGVLISNSQHARIIGGEIYGKRHAVGVGGGNLVCSVPVRDFRCYQATLSNAPSMIIGAADMHGNVEDSSYEDCIIYGGTNMGGGGENYYKRCVIKSDAANGRIGYLREVKGGRFGYIDCESESFANPQAQNHGVFDIGGSSDVLTSATTSDVDLIVSGGYVKSRAWTSLTHLVLMRNAGTNVNVNIEVNPLHIDANALGNIIRTALTTGVANSKRMIVDNITGTYPSNNMASHAGNAYLNVPHRIQKQSGTVQVTTAADLGGQAIQAFKFAYPRTPLTTVSLAGSGILGGKPLLVYSHLPSITGMRPAWKSYETLTAGNLLDLNWSAELREC